MQAQSSTVYFFLSPFFSFSSSILFICKWLLTRARQQAMATSSIWRRRRRRRRRSKLVSPLNLVVIFLARNILVVLMVGVHLAISTWRRQPLQTKIVLLHIPTPLATICITYTVLLATNTLPCKLDCDPRSSYYKHSLDWTGQCRWGSRGGSHFFFFFFFKYLLGPSELRHKMGGALSAACYTNWRSGRTWQRSGCHNQTAMNKKKVMGMRNVIHSVVAAAAAAAADSFASYPAGSLPFIIACVDCTLGTTSELMTFADYLVICDI